MKNETRAAIYSLIDLERRDGESIYNAAKRILTAEAIHRSGGSIARAADLLGVTRATVYNAGERQ